MKLRLLLIPLLLAATPAALAQSAPAPVLSDPASFDTSYSPSPSVSARLQRQFLEDIRWSAGIEARDSLRAAFTDRSPTEIWLELVAADGLEADNVTDALTSYWVLNWITANAAYSVEIDHAPVQRQLAAAFAQDAGFRRVADQQRQELAEGYILNFLLEHAALNDAVERRDVRALSQLAAASVARFREQMGVNLLALQPGPNGFEARAE